MTELATINFHGTGISVLTNDQGDWIFPGQICKNLGIDANGQKQAIERSRWSEGWTCVTHVMLPGQDRTYPQFALHSRRFAMWLATITASRIKDENARALVDQYQSEAADVLADWLAKRSAPAEPKPAIPNLLDLESDQGKLATLSLIGQMAETARAAVLEGAHVKAKLLASEARVQETRAVVAELKPKAESFDRFQNADDHLDVREAAKIMNIPGVGGQNLFDVLRELGYLIGHTIEPKQEYLNRKPPLFDYVPVPYIHPPTGEKRLRFQLFIRPSFIASLERQIRALMEKEGMEAYVSRRTRQRHQEQEEIRRIADARPPLRLVGNIAYSV